MEPADREATYFVAGQIARWQDDAQQLPLGDVRVILLDRQDDLTAVLENFNRALSDAGDDGDAYQAEALSWAMTQILSKPPPPRSSPCT